jgi:hypothetical protein
MERIASDLQSIETDDEPDETERAARITAADADRRAAGRPPLDGQPLYPEEEFYRRARALGLRPSRR